MADVADAFRFKQDLGLGIGDSQNSPGEFKYGELLTIAGVEDAR